ncbi:hypothetical protein NMY22_g7870 [Coprinellus aureogranulatus]|nr:hypothetical protein NMY22_g7870 [Coprinellus aureogranulatus]
MRYYPDTNQHLARLTMSTDAPTSSPPASPKPFRARITYNRLVDHIQPQKTLRDQQRPRLLLAWTSSRRPFPPRTSSGDRRPPTGHRPPRVPQRGYIVPLVPPSLSELGLSSLAPCSLR